MSTHAQPTEEQLKAYEEELSRISSAEIVVQAAASLLSIGGHRLGLGEGREQQRDLDQVCDAIDGVRALMPIVERRLAAGEARQLRDALSQLQMGYARLVKESGQAGAGQGAATGGPASQQPAPGGPTPQQPAPGGPGSQQPASSGSEQGGARQQAGQGEDKRGPGPAESSGRLWVPGR